MNESRPQGNPIVNGIILIVFFAIIVVIALFLSPTLVKELNEKDILYNQETVFELAARNYFNEHPEKLPDKIGEEKYVSLADLIDRSYVEEIRDNEDKECKYDVSEVSVVKIGDNHYKYYVDLFCENYASLETWGEWSDWEEIETDYAYNVEGKEVQDETQIVYNYAYKNSQYTDWSNWEEYDENADYSEYDIELRTMYRYKDSKYKWYNITNREYSEPQPVVSNDPEPEEPTAPPVVTPTEPDPEPIVAGEGYYFKGQQPEGFNEIDENDFITVYKYTKKVPGAITSKYYLSAPENFPYKTDYSRKQYYYYQVEGNPETEIRYYVDINKYNSVSSAFQGYLSRTYPGLIKGYAAASSYSVNRVYFSFDVSSGSTDGSKTCTSSGSSFGSSFFTSHSAAVTACDKTVAVNKLNSSANHTSLVGSYNINPKTIYRNSPTKVDATCTCIVYDRIIGGKSTFITLYSRKGVSKSDYTKDRCVTECRSRYVSRNDYYFRGTVNFSATPYNEKIEGYVGSVNYKQASSRKVTHYTTDVHFCNKYPAYMGCVRTGSITVLENHYTPSGEQKTGQEKWAWEGSLSSDWKKDSTVSPKVYYKYQAIWSTTSYNNGSWVLNAPSSMSSSGWTKSDEAKKYKYYKIIDASSEGKIEKVSSDIAATTKNYTKYYYSTNPGGYPYMDASKSITTDWTDWSVNKPKAASYREIDEVVQVKKRTLEEKEGEPVMDTYVDSDTFEKITGADPDEVLSSSDYELLTKLKRRYRTRDDLASYTTESGDYFGSGVTGWLDTLIRVILTIIMIMILFVGPPYKEKYLISLIVIATSLIALFLDFYVWGILRSWEWVVIGINGLIFIWMLANRRTTPRSGNFVQDE